MVMYQGDPRVPVMDRPPVVGSDVDVPEPRTEDPSSGYMALLTDGRPDSYTVVIGSGAMLKNGYVNALQDDINLLTFYPSSFLGKGDIFDMTLDFSEHSGSTVVGTESKYGLKGIVGITEFELDSRHLQVAAFYGSGRFVIPSVHVGPFPYTEIKKSQLDALTDLFEVYRRERSHAAMNKFKSFLQNLFSDLDMRPAEYFPVITANLPEDLRGYKAWPKLR